MLRRRLNVVDNFKEKIVSCEEGNTVFENQSPSSKKTRCFPFTKKNENMFVRKIFSVYSERGTGSINKIYVYTTAL